jgi:hypothetical protein
MPTNTQRVRLLRRAVAELYAAAGGTNPEGTDIARFLLDSRVVAEARIAVAMVTRGQVDGQ